MKRHANRAVENMVRKSKPVSDALFTECYQAAITDCLATRYEREITIAEIDALPKKPTAFRVAAVYLSRVHLHGKDGWKFDLPKTDGDRLRLTEWAHTDSLVILRHMATHGWVKDPWIDLPDDLASPPLVRGVLDFPTATDLQIKEIDHADFVGRFIIVAGLNWLSRYYLPLVHQRSVGSKKPKMWDSVRDSLPRWFG